MTVVPLQLDGKSHSVIAVNRILARCAFCFTKVIYTLRLKNNHEFLIWLCPNNRKNKEQQILWKGQRSLINGTHPCILKKVSWGTVSKQPSSQCQVLSTPFQRCFHLSPWPLKISFSPCEFSVSLHVTSPYPFLPCMHFQGYLPFIL